MRGRNRAAVLAGVLAMTVASIGGSTVFAMMAFAVMVAVSMVAMAPIVVIVRMATVVSVVVMVVGIVVSVRSAVRALATAVCRAGYRPARVAMARRARLIRGRWRIVCRDAIAGT